MGVMEEVTKRTDRHCHSICVQCNLKCVVCTVKFKATLWYILSGLWLPKVQQSSDTSALLSPFYPNNLSEYPAHNVLEQCRVKNMFVIFDVPLDSLPKKPI